MQPEIATHSLPLPGDEPVTPLMERGESSGDRVLAAPSGDKDWNSTLIESFERK